jgi:two-component system alkaline phosphatase synthesis response regulator PhoP
MEAKTRILIIDDDPDYVEGIKSILEKADYEVEAVYNPEDGFNTLKSKPFDLLLLDIMMGRGAEGVMVARKISKDPKLRETPTLIITGIREQIAYLFPGQPLHPHFLPVDELIEKPVEPELLLEKVSKLLRLSEERKAKSGTE